MYHSPTSTHEPLTALDTLRRSTHAEVNQKTSNILDKGSLGHEEEGGSEDGLDNLGRNALVESRNTLILDDLAESVHDRAVPLLGIVRLLQLHTGLHHAIFVKLSCRKVMVRDRLC